MHITHHLHPPAWEDKPTTIRERLNIYINDHGRTTYHHVGKASTFTSTTMGGPTYHHVGKSYVYMRLPNSSLSLGRNLDLKYTKLLSEVFKLHSGYF